jgi:site-specific recombinase XerD
VNAFQIKDSWLTELALSGASPATITAYRANVSEALLSIAHQRGVILNKLSMADVTREGVIAAMAEYHSRPDGRNNEPVARSAASVSSFFGALRSFLSWCVESGHLPANPAARVRPPKVGHRIPKAMSQEECSALLRAAERSRTPERDSLVVLLCLGVGLRLSEIASLRLDSFVPNLTAPTHLRVIGKGNKERTIPVPEPVTVALSAYLPVRGALQERRGVRGTSLFVQPRVGGESPNSARDQVGLVFERLVWSAGIKERGRRAHATRHSFATHVLAGGADILSVSDLLGHSSVATTQVYLKVNPARLSGAVSSNPLMRLVGDGGVNAS